MMTDPSASVRTPASVVSAATPLTLTAVPPAVTVNALAGGRLSPSRSSSNVTDSERPPAGTLGASLASFGGVTSPVPASRMTTDTVSPSDQGDAVTNQKIWVRSALVKWLRVASLNGSAVVVPPTVARNDSLLLSDSRAALGTTGLTRRLTETEFSNIRSTV